MLGLNLPYQFGRKYRITPNLVARTRTIFSKRMQGINQQILLEALKLAQDSLIYTIGKIEFKPLISGTSNPPQYDGIESFTNAFITVFNIDVQTVSDYNTLLFTFQITCNRILHGLLLPLQLIDVRISIQDSNKVGYVSTYRTPTYHLHGLIHINFGVIQPNNKWRLAELLVHEASHKFADTLDYAYLHNVNRISQLGHDLLLHNADSIARMVIRTYRARLQ